MPLLSSPHHFGLVVEDVERAKAEIGATLGLRWAKTQSATALMESAEGRIPVDATFVYSIEGPPHIELLERRPDVPIYADLGLHHIAVWTDDPVSGSAELEVQGWRRENVAVTPDGEWMGGVYHVLTDGLRVELLDIVNSGPRFVRWLSGGDYMDPA